MSKEGSNNRPVAASKKAGGPAKAKSDQKETRLAEALRANLRRRKAPNAAPDTLMDKKED